MARALLALGDAEPQAGDKSQGGLKVRVGVWWDLGMGEGLKVSTSAGGTAGDALGVGCSSLGLAPRGSLKSSS